MLVINSRKKGVVMRQGNRWRHSQVCVALLKKKNMLEFHVWIIIYYVLVREKEKEREKKKERETAHIHFFLLSLSLSLPHSSFPSIHISFYFLSPTFSLLYLFLIHPLSPFLILSPHRFSLFPYPLFSTPPVTPLTLKM